MCSVVILRRPGHDWPVILGANRDEMSERPWLPPGRHWPDRPWVVAGLDQLAGGSWLGLNDHGVVAGIMNRPQSLGPAAGQAQPGRAGAGGARPCRCPRGGRGPRRARPGGLSPLQSDPRGQPRGLLDPPCRGAASMRRPIPPGLSMLTAHDLNDAAGSRRIGHFLPLFRAAPGARPRGRRLAGLGGAAGKPRLRRRRQAATMP